MIRRQPTKEQKAACDRLTLYLVSAILLIPIIFI